MQKMGKALSSHVPHAVLGLGLTLIVCIYSLAWTGKLQFDDAANLDGLFGINDFNSALIFILTGEAGPTGRPVSLASFALQHNAWPNPRPFLIVNTLLHAVNGLLCFLFLSRILRWRISNRQHADWLAVGIALAWTASPFLCTTHLMVVQRMTGLSGFFTLLCLWLYATKRESYHVGSWCSNLQLAIIAGICTVTAGLSKENGFLLPLFLLLLERLLIRDHTLRFEPLNPWILIIVLGIPASGILSYLLYLTVFETPGYQTRDFSLSERLLTQPRVLFDYAHQIILPKAKSITPFHDNYPLSTSPLQPRTTLPALFGLALVLGLAWRLRRSTPVISFGILFYFAGHLLESTVIPLEVYFPHRNYIPALGLYLVVGQLIYQLALRKPHLSRVICGAGSCYVLILFFVLASTTSLWGRPTMAAALWAEQKPPSLRAGLYLYKVYSETISTTEATKINARLMTFFPDEPVLMIQALEGCTGDPGIYREKLAKARQSLDSATMISTNISRSLQSIASAASTSYCPHLGIEEVEGLIAAARRKMSRYTPPQAKANLLFAEAQLANKKGKPGEAAELLERSMNIAPTLDAAALIAYFHLENGDPAAARKHLSMTIAEPPVNWPATLAWHRRLTDLLNSLPAH